MLMPVATAMPQQSPHRGRSRSRRRRRHRRHSSHSSTSTQALQRRLQRRKRTDVSSNTAAAPSSGSMQTSATDKQDWQGSHQWQQDQWQHDQWQHHWNQDQWKRSSQQDHRSWTDDSSWQKWSDQGWHQGSWQSKDSWKTKKKDKVWANPSQTTPAPSQPTMPTAGTAAPPPQPAPSLPCPPLPSLLPIPPPPSLPPPPFPFPPPLPSLLPIPPPPSSLHVPPTLPAQFSTPPVPAPPAKFGNVGGNSQQVIPPPGTMCLSAKAAAANPPSAVPQDAGKDRRYQPYQHKPTPSMTQELMESARTVLATRKIRSFAELTAHERPQPDHFSDSDAQDLYAGIHRLDPKFPLQTRQMIADIVYGSGNSSMFLLDKMSIFDCDRIYRILLIPYNAPEVSTFGIEDGIDPSQGFKYSYVGAHGCDPSAGFGIASDSFIRPSSWSGSIEGSHAEYPTTGFNCQGTLGDVSAHTLQTIFSRVLKTPKGQQGVIAVTQTFSKFSHHKLTSRSVSDEQRIVARTGAVSGPERWTMHAEHSVIRLFAFARAL